MVAPITMTPNSPPDKTMTAHMNMNAKDDDDFDDASSSSYSLSQSSPRGTPAAPANDSKTAPSPANKTKPNSEKQAKKKPSLLRSLLARGKAAATGARRRSSYSNLHGDDNHDGDNDDGTTAKTSKQDSTKQSNKGGRSSSFDPRLFRFLLERTWDDDERLTEIVLDNWFIGDDNLKLLSDALATNTHVTTLSLRHNDITARGCRHLSLALEQNMSISRVYLDDNDLRDDGVQYIIQALTDHTAHGNASLLELGLCRTNLSQGGAQELAETLKGHKDRLDIRSVYLEGGGNTAAANNDSGGINDWANGSMREIEDDISCSMSSRASAVFVVEPGAFETQEGAVDEAQSIHHEGSQQDRQERRSSDRSDASVGGATATELNGIGGAAETTKKTVKRLGVVYAPPTFLVEYELRTTAATPGTAHTPPHSSNNNEHNNNVYHKKIFLKSLKPTSKPHKVSKALINAHPDCLSDQHVTYDQVERLVRALIEHYDPTKPTQFYEDPSVDGMHTASILEEVQRHPSPEERQEEEEEAYQFSGLREAMHLAALSSSPPAADKDYLHLQHQLLYGNNGDDDSANDHFQHEDDRKDDDDEEEEDDSSCDSDDDDSDDSDDEEEEDDNSYGLNDMLEDEPEAEKKKKKGGGGLFRSMRRRVTGR